MKWQPYQTLLGNKHSGEVNSPVIEVCAFNDKRYRRMLTMQHRILRDATTRPLIHRSKRVCRQNVAVTN